jgi:hypothetical protein
VPVEALETCMDWSSVLGAASISQVIFSFFASVGSAMTYSPILKLTSDTPILTNLMAILDNKTALTNHQDDALIKDIFLII